MLNLDNVFHSNEYPQLELHVQGKLDSQQTSRANKLTEIVAKALKLQKKGESIVVSIDAKELSLPGKEFDLLEACCEKILKQVSKPAISIPLRKRDAPRQQMTQRKRDALPDRPIEMKSLRGRVREISSEPTDLAAEEKRVRMLQASDKTKLLAMGIFLLLLAIGAALTMGILAIPAIGILATLSTTALATTASTVAVAGSIFAFKGIKTIIRQSIFGENNYLLQKRVAHLHGDLFIGNTNMESGSPLIMMQYLSRVLSNKIEALKKTKGDPAKIERFEKILRGNQTGLNLIEDIGIKYYMGKLTPANVAKYISPICQALKDLPPGEKIIFPSGWDNPQSSQGHAIYLECTKEQNGTFRLKVYNVGEGIEYHNTVTEINPGAPGKEPKLVEKCHPYVELANISADRMTDETLWRSLIEIRVFGETPPEFLGQSASKYAPEDIYACILPALHGEIVEHPYDKFKHEYMEPQHASICTWAGLRALLHHNLTEKEFAELEHEMQVGSLSEIYEAFQNLESLKDDEQARFLMQKSAEHLSTRSLENYKSGLITLSELELANAVVSKVNTRLQAAELLVQQSRQLSAEQLRFTPIRGEVYGEGVNKIAVQDLTTKESAISYKPTTQFWDTDWQPDLNEIDVQLKTFCETYSKSIKGEPHAVYNCLRGLFLKLPIPSKENDTFWSKIPPEKLHSCMESIATLSELMAVAAAQEKQNPTYAYSLDASICLHKGFAIQHKLATCDKELQGQKVQDWQLSPSIELLNCLEENSYEFFNLYDSDLLKQVKELYQYLGRERSFFRIDSHIYSNPMMANGQKEYLNEADFVFRYVQQHRKEFDKVLGKEYEKAIANMPKKAILTEFERKEKEDMNRATFALTDWQGKFLPKTFCLLRRQAIATSLEKYHKKIGLDFFEGNPYMTHVRPDTVEVIYKDSNQDLSVYPHEYTQSEALEKYSRRREFGNHEFSQITRRSPVKTEILSPKERLDMFGIVVQSIPENQIRAPELKIVKAIQYLKMNITKLSEHDVQLFLRETLFKSGDMEQLLQRNPEFLENIFSLIQTGYQQFTDPIKVNISGAACMIYLGQMIKKHVEELAQESSLYSTAREMITKNAPKQIQQPEIYLNELLKLCKTDQEKSLVYRQMIYQFSLLSDKEFSNISSSDPKLTEMITALSYLQTNAAHPNYHLDNIVEQFRSSRMMPKLLSMDKNNEWKTGERESLTKHLLKVLGFDKDVKELNWEVSSPLWIGKWQGKDICVFNTENCNLQFVSHKNVALPEIIKRHNEFRQAFTKWEDQTVRAKGFGLYEFDDANESLVRVKQTGEYEIVIQRQFKKDGPWYQFVPKPEKMYALKNDDLMLYHNHWASLDNRQVMLCPKGTSKITHQINIENNGSFQIVHPDVPELQLINNSRPLTGERLGLYSKLNDFEPINYTHTWVNSKTGKPHLIEMAQMGLDFEIKESRAHCIQEPGFYISENQFVKDMGSFKNYLVLQNDAGKVKILIPRKQVIAAAAGGLSSQVKLYSTLPESKTQLPPYYSYNLNAKGQLKPMHEGGSLHLAYILQGQRRYKEAQNCLRQGAEKLKRYTVRELENIEWVTSLQKSLGDQDPKSVATYLTFMSWLIKNFQIHGQTSVKEYFESSRFDKENLKSIYMTYVSGLNYMGDLALTHHEELSILRELATMFPGDNFIKDRLAFLTQSLGTLNQAAPVIPKPQKEQMSMRYWMQELRRDIPRKLRNRTTAENTSKNPILFTRPDLNFYAFDFESAYKQAKTVSEADRTKFLMTLELQKSFMQRNNESLSFLMGVALSPKDFPDWNTFKTHLEEDGKQKEDKSLSRTKISNFQMHASRAKNIFERYESSALSKKSPETIAVTNKPDFVLKTLTETAVTPSLPASVKVNSENIVNTLFTVTPAESNEKYAKELSERLTKETVSKAYKNDSKLHDISQKKLLDDILAYSKQPGDPTILLKGVDNPETLKKNLTATRGEIENTRIASETLTRKLGQDILSLANKSTHLQEREIVATHLAELQSTQKEKMTLDGLCVMFLKNNPKDLKDLNPLLTQNDIDNLRLMLTTYLTRTIEEQALTRQVQALDAITSYIGTKTVNANDPTLQELCSKAVFEISSKSAYDPTKEFSWMIFEYYTGFRLRKDQVEALKQILQRPDIIQEAIMGTGKSKVWLPLLMIMMADGDNFPVTLLTPAQYSTTIRDLRTLLGSVVKKVVHTISFDRNTEFTVAKLQNIYDYLNEIRINARTGLISTAHVFKSLLLKYREALMQLEEFPNDGLLVQKIELLKKILGLFKRKGRAIIDEADTVLNARHEVNFTVGEGKPLPQQRCQMIASIYVQLRDPEIMNLMKAKPLVEDLSLLSTDYHKRIKGPLLNKIIHAIRQNPQDPLYDLFQSEANRKQVQAYLDGSGTSVNEEFIKSIPNSITRDLLALLKEELNNMLPFTLNKLYRVDFGPSQKSPERVLSIPYSGNDNPVETSEFASSDILANFTIQTCWREGIPTSSISQLIKSLQTEANKEKKRLNLSSTIDTTAYRSFQFLISDDKELQSINLFECTDEHCALIAKKFNEARFRQPQRFMKYISDFILPQIVIYSKQLTANAQDLVGMFKTVIGFTGTPWNSDSYPEKLRGNTKTAVGIIGKTAVLISKKTSETTDGIRVLQDTSYPHLIDSLVRENDSALIDAGALFNGHTHEEVAKGIFSLLQSRNSNKKGVIFFRRNTPMIIEKTPYGTRTIPLAESNLKPEERFTYYDQAHSTGIDINQSLLAQATLTVGKDSSTRDKAQGAFRLRGLEKRQGLSIVVSPEASERIYKIFELPTTLPITYEHIYGFVNNNQTDQQITQIQLATKQKINAVIQQEIDKRLFEIDLSQLTPAQRGQLVKEISPFIVNELSNSPFDNYGEQEVLLDRSVVIGKLIEKAVAKLEAINGRSLLFKGEKANFIENVQKLIKAELSDSVDLLPSKLSSHMIGNKNSEGQVEREHQKEQQKETDLDLELTTLAQNKAPDDAKFKYERQRWWVRMPPQIFSRATYATPPFKNRPVYDKGRAAIDQLSQTEYVELHHKGFDAYEERGGHPMSMYGVDDICANTTGCEKIAPLMKGIIATVNRFPAEVKDIINVPQLPTQFVLYIRDKRTGSMKLQLLDSVSDMSFFWIAINQHNQGIYNTMTDELDLCLCDLNGEIVAANQNQDKDAFAKSLREQGVDLRVRAKLFVGDLFYTPEEERYLQKLIKTNKEEIESLFRDHLLPQDPLKLLLFKNSELFEWLGKPSWVHNLIREVRTK